MASHNSSCPEDVSNRDRPSILITGMRQMSLSLGDQLELANDARVCTSRQTSGNVPECLVKPEIILETDPISHMERLVEDQRSKAHNATAAATLFAKKRTDANIALKVAENNYVLACNQEQQANEDAERQTSKLEELETELNRLVRKKEIDELEKQMRILAEATELRQAEMAKRLSDLRMGIN